ncbi:KTSC domain-containing protein [Chitinophaga solisilvae]|uniref:KTSC domain-containing protein n=1 Tax=Chitinophaga solisilvae TaxID=1233460 RepID=UPI00136B3817|nr:KTSC domain-containing protein [Chitinophaga solisilvae]
MPSSVIRKYDYDPENAVLRILFVSGAIYDYLDVPESVYKSMKQTISKGVFFNQEIKDKYTFRKIK